MKKVSFSGMATIQQVIAIILLAVHSVIASDTTITYMGGDQIGTFYFQEPINLFNPQEGQSLNLMISDVIQSDMATDCEESICIENINGDSAEYSYVIICYLSPENLSNPPRRECGGTPNHNMYWENGVLHAPDLLVSGMIDTNGIYENELNFPFPDVRASGTHINGYSLNGTVSGITFDTLLLSCSYVQYNETSGCKNCDLLTTNGYLVQSNGTCYNVPGSWTRYYLSEEAFNKVVTTPVLPRRNSVNSLYNAEAKKTYNIKGQSNQHPFFGISVRKMNPRKKNLNHKSDPR